MGQIIYGKQTPKYCSLVAIQAGGSKADTVLANGEIWLVDTTNATKVNGTGVYDAYIKGDGNKAAKNLTVEYLSAKVDLSAYSTTAQMNAAIQSAVSGKADKSEMSVVAGTGADADKTTITLKNGTSITVLTQHQDVSEFLKGGEVFGTGDDSTASFNPYSDTVWNKEQDLSVAQKHQIQENIGIPDVLATKADINNTYTKAEVNNLIVPANTEIVVVSSLPASGVANTIYRVAGTTSYSDYGWDGTQFVKLAEYSNAYDAGGALS